MVAEGQNKRAVKQILVLNLRISGAIPLFPSLLLRTTILCPKLKEAGGNMVCSAYERHKFLVKYF